MADPKKEKESTFEETNEVTASEDSDLATLALCLGRQEEDQNRDKDVSEDREGSFRIEEPDTEDIIDTDEFDNDVKLATLAMHLRRTAPSTTIDPSFRESLRRQILDAVRQQEASDNTFGETGKPLIRYISC